MNPISALLDEFIGTGNILLFALLDIPVICGSALIIVPVRSYVLSKLPYETNQHGVVLISTGFQVAGCIGSSAFTDIFAAFSAIFGETIFSYGICRQLI